jgi:uncharacterized protein YkwD
MAYGVMNPRDVVMSLIIDDGVPSRGHRENTLNPKFSCSGVGAAPHAKFNHVFTIDFAGGMSISALTPAPSIPLGSVRIVT